MNAILKRTIGAPSQTSGRDLQLLTLLTESILGLAVPIIWMEAVHVRVVDTTLPQQASRFQVIKADRAGFCAKLDPKYKSFRLIRVSDDPTSVVTKM
jgi:hypothetical protein